MSDYESSNDETILDIFKQFKPTPDKTKGKRRRRSNLQSEFLPNGQQKSDLSPEELEILRKKADAERKKRRRREMTAEERKRFLERENERKRLQRLKSSFDANRAKEAERKREKRKAMTPEEREAFRAKDAQRKRLARLKKKMELAKENESAYDTSNSNEPLLKSKETSNGTLNETILKPKRGRPRKNPDNNNKISAVNTKKNNSVNKAKTITKETESNDEAMKQIEDCVYGIIYEPELVANKEVKDGLLKIVDPNENDPRIVKDKLDNVHSRILNQPIVLQKGKTSHEGIFTTQMNYVNYDDILQAETPPLMLHDSSLSEFESTKEAPVITAVQALEKINDEIQLLNDTILNIDNIEAVEEISEKIVSQAPGEIILELTEISDENIIKRQAEIALELEEINRKKNPEEEIVVKVNEISEENLAQNEFALEVTEINEDTHSNDQGEVVLETIDYGTVDLTKNTDVLDYPIILVDEQGNEISSKWHFKS